MKITQIISSVIALGGLLLCSCTTDGGDSGTSESTAIKGTSTVSGFSMNRTFTKGSAFMYRRGHVYYFLLCEGEARSWSKAKELPHLEIHILDDYIATDPMAMADPSKTIDINGTAKKVYVCWAPGNGIRFIDKNNFSTAQGNYPFEKGDLSVGKFGYDMYTIAFVGGGKDNKDEYREADFSYGGQFSRN